MSERGATPEFPDWEIKEQFDYADTLTLPEWGWEFLRRNPNYRKSWESAQRDFTVGARSGAARVIEATNPATALLEWGCLYSSAPILNARSAIVFWQPDLCPKVLRLTALPLSSAIAAEAFCLRELKCPSVLLRGFTDAQHLLFRDRGRGLQLAVHGPDILDPVRLVADSAPGYVFARDQFRSLRCFMDLRLSGKLMPSHFQREALSPRLKHVLRALDGALAGASHREIGTALFGEERIRAEWTARGRPLRYKVRRAVHRGYELMRGGYRGFLR
ncbi:MAG TPA: DUF2285 domain-containing protein [Rhizomicrobium sp.]